MFLFRKRKAPRAIHRQMVRAAKVLWDVDIKYEDGSERKFESALSVYPIGEHGSHLRIEFDGASHQSSFIIISLAHISQVEGLRREEEPETENASIP